MPQGREELFEPIPLFPLFLELWIVKPRIRRAEASIKEYARDTTVSFCTSYRIAKLIFREASLSKGSCLYIRSEAWLNKLCPTS